MKADIQRTRVLMTILALFAAFAGSRATAQGTGSISGTVLDIQQAAIAGSQIVLTNTESGQRRTVLASSSGYFNFTDVAPGQYRIRVDGAGFKAWEQSSITLAVEQQLTVYPRLEVGSASEQIEVSDTPPAINTSTSSISQVVDSAKIVELPLNGRNALQLVALTPGVVSTGTAGQFGAAQISFASSGGRDIDTNYSLDGGYNKNSFYAIASEYPNPDALQEFAVSSRNYSAKFGLGSTDVSAVTRSGTNHIHGSVFEFLRNTNLDAAPFLSSVRPDFHRNQFGGSFGGPLRTGKAFYFLSYQGTDQSGSPGVSAYPTTPIPQRTGDFSQLSTPVIDPTTGKEFPGNVIPTDRITSQASKFFTDFLPDPNQGDAVYSFPSANTLKQHQGIAKIDWQATHSDLIFVRYFMNDIPQHGPGGGATLLKTSWLSDLPTRFQNTTVGHLHTFSPNLLNDFHLSYVRAAFAVFPLVDFSLSGLGYGVNTQNAFTNYGLTPDSALCVTGAYCAYPAAPTRDIAPTYHLSDNVSWVKGSHTINAGIEIYKNRINETQNFFTGGAIFFSGQFTGVPAADFLLGNFNFYEQIGGLSSRLHQTLPSGYVQDDVKLTPRLTASVGVRWDIVSGYSSENNQLATLQPGRQSTVFPLATTGLLFPGDPGIPKNIVGTRWNNITPRIGLAWDVKGNGRTSVRAGFGSFAVPLTRGITFNRLTLIQPFTLEATTFGGDGQNIFAGAPYNGVNPFPRPTASDIQGLKQIPFQPGAGTSSLPTTFKTETDYEWSLSVQHQLGRSGVLEADYIGSSSSHLTTSAESNPAIYQPGNSTTGNTQSRRLYPQIGSVNSILSALSSNYHSLQIVYSQQFATGLSVKSAYTWSRALGVGGAETEGDNGPRDPFNYRLDYGPIDFDVKHNSVTSMIWQPLAARKFDSPLVGAVVDGWQLGAIAILHTGTPLNLLSGVDNSFTNIGKDTPDVIGNYQAGNHSKADELAHWFNPGAFAPNAIGTFGTLGHNALRNPGFANYDLNIQKNFRFQERYRLEFRSSLYNAFNHANLNSPVATRNSGSFGKILTATDPRVVEFGTRITF